MFLSDIKKVIKLLVFLFVFLSLLTRSARAQVPDPYVPCNQTESEEFHSLRPYQKSPCDQSVSETANFCGNDLVLSDSIVRNASQTSDCVEIATGGKTKCNFTVDRSFEIAIDLSGAELPIAGNTELVKNSQSSGETLDSAEKVAGYISWYLNGVTDRLEYPKSSEDNVVNFSGPIKKLLPLDVKHSYQIATIEEAKKERHDQKIVDNFRLTDWDGKISSAPTLPGTWNERVPPLESDFDDLILYQKAYNEWRGDSCILISIPFTDIDFLGCGDNPARPNRWADLFPYVPLSSTEDRKGLVKTNTVSVQASGDVEISNVEFSDQSPADLFFAHMQESAELAKILQQTIVPQGNSQTGTASKISPAPFCDLVRIRTNPGDDLFAGEISGNLSYTAKFSCVLDPDDPTDTCTKNPSILMSLITETPKADEIWERLVAGPSSIFKRLFPQVGLDSAIEGLLDIPAATKVTYSGSGLVYAGNPDNQRSGESAELYFPHLGGVKEYFLGCTQTLLRPKGYGEVCESGPPATADCNPVLPKLPTSDPSCVACSRYDNLMPPTMRKIFESAASYYKVPANVLVGIFWNEGAFQRYDWTDESVLAASGPSCQVPSCQSYNVSSTGAIGPFQLFPSTFKSGNDAAVLDNGKTGISDGRTPDPCNLLDAAFTTARMLSRGHHGHSGYEYPTCVGVDLNTGSGSGSCNWDDSDVVTGARQYLGYCESPIKAEQSDIYPTRPDCTLKNIDECYQKSVLNFARCQG